MNDRNARERRDRRLAESAKATRRPLPSPTHNQTPETPLATLPPSALPEIWHFDSKNLLQELARIRELALHVPVLRNDQLAPINSVINAIWQLEQTARFLIELKGEMQTDFRAKANDLHPTPNQHAGRQTEAQPVNAHRRISARVA